MSMEDKALKFTGVGDSYHVRLQRWIPFPECGVDITTGSTMAHHRRIHGEELVIDWNWLPVSHGENHPQVYDVRFPGTLTVCPGPPLKRNDLRSHFRIQHWGIESVSSRNTQNTSPGASAAGAKYQRGG